MKPVIVIFTLASAIVAQDLGDLPPCAKNCLAEFTTGNQIGNCARLDAKCICGSDTFINGIACWHYGSPSIRDVREREHVGDKHVGGKHVADYASFVIVVVIDDGAGRHSHSERGFAGRNGFQG
ncbi:hypothetical protein F4777DRAFT_573758 [Nemania sp. FL0916]|nr:hypothetical protein F4777DRAFT_573758 [Nemania sp. FL0916]